MSTFRVVSLLWHSKENKYYETGEVIDLSHLDGFTIAALLQSGAIVPITPEKEKKKKPTQEGE